MNEPDTPINDRFADYDYSIKHQAVSFQQVFEAYLYKNEKPNPDLKSRSCYEGYYPDLLKTFQDTHGAIRECYYDTHAQAGAVLTEKDEFYFDIYDDNPTNMGIRKLLNQCSWLHIESHELLRDHDRRVLAEKIYDICVHLLSGLQTSGQIISKSETASRERMLGMIREELERTKERSKLSAQRQAQLNYFTGMLRGMLIVLMAAATGFVVEHFYSDRFTFSFELVSLCLLLGGVGAVISVMSRMTFGGLVLDYQAGSSQLLRLGLFRPIIGAVFGVVVYITVASKLLPIEISHGGSEQLFFAGLAFLAGFSERWAQDMLTRTEGRITATLRQKAQPPQNTQTKTSKSQSDV